MLQYLTSLALSLKRATPETPCSGIHSQNSPPLGGSCPQKVSRSGSSMVISQLPTLRKSGLGSVPRTRASIR